MDRPLGSNVQSDSFNAQSPRLGHCPPIQGNNCQQRIHGRSSQENLPLSWTYIRRISRSFAPGGHVQARLRKRRLCPCSGRASAEQESSRSIGSHVSSERAPPASNRGRGTRETQVAVSSAKTRGGNGV